MKRILLKAVVVLGAVGAVLLAGGLAFMPACDVLAIPGCRCLPEEVTPIVTGVSTVDCPWAKMDAESKADAFVDCPSGEFCDYWLEVIDDNDCQKFWPSGEFRVQARLHYSCGTCD